MCSWGKGRDCFFVVVRWPIPPLCMWQPMNPLLAAVMALKQAGKFKIPVWKILPGLLVEYDKIYMLSQFGAATEKLTAATLGGDLDKGIQFIGQVHNPTNPNPWSRPLPPSCSCGDACMDSWCCARSGGRHCGRSGLRCGGFQGAK
jgi:hypothetical protein